MRASDAREVAVTYTKKMEKEWEDSRKKHFAEEAHLFNKRKKERWDSLISEIEATVDRISAKGGREFLLDDIYHFAPADRILYKAVNEDFAARGFTTVEYQYFGLMLKW